MAIRVTRKAHRRRAYIKRDRTRVRSSFVDKTTFLSKDMGKPGRTPESGKWAHVEPGSLKGWKKDSSAESRRKILSGIVAKEDYATAVRRLNQLANLTTDAETRQAARSDMSFLKEKYR